MQNDEPEQPKVDIAEERLKVGKVRRETGRVRVQTRVARHEVVIDEPLRQDEVRVERVRIDRYVTERPTTREEGNTLVIPVVEEVAVVEKRLLLKEEVRITRTEREIRRPRRVTLRRTEAQVETQDEPQDEPPGPDLR